MATKEQVLAYFEKWAGNGKNPENGCVIVYRELDEFIERGATKSIMGWAVEYRDRDFLVPKEYADDADFEIAARILRLPEWVAVTDRLPPEGVVVLAYNAEWCDEGRLVAIFDSCFVDSNGDWQAEFGDIPAPTHWTYLPAQP